MLNVADLFNYDLYNSSRLDKSWSNFSNSAYRVEMTEEGVILSIDLPGVKSKDLSVQTTGHEIKISGKVRGEDFKYSYKLSKNYNPNSVDAHLEDGVLSLKFFKTNDALTKTVDVKVK